MLRSILLLLPLSLPLPVLSTLPLLARRALHLLHQQEALLLWPLELRLLSVLLLPLFLPDGCLCLTALVFLATCIFPPTSFLTPFRKCDRETFRIIITVVFVFICSLIDPLSILNKVDDVLLLLLFYSRPDERGTQRKREKVWIRFIDNLQRTRKSR